ncbi:MAG: hypothetical protein ACRYG5_18435 [Janthinobacterium lividum]
MFPSIQRVPTPPPSIIFSPGDPERANPLDTSYPRQAFYGGAPVATAPYGGDLIRHLQVDRAGFLNGTVIEQLDRAAAPLLRGGCAIRRGVDQFGLFTVNQAAIEFPLGIPGLVGKYGMQMNLVRPRLPGSESNYFLQLFPVHDELGFDYLKMLGIDSSDVPLGCGGQLVRNHGIEIQLNPPTADGPSGAAKRTHYYVEELLIRPAELDPKYRIDAVQGTLGSEFGCHLKWKLDNPNLNWAVVSNFAGNAVGGWLGYLAAATAGLSNLAIPAAHAGAILGALCTHYGQLRFPSLKPDVVLSWAGATYGPADVNQPFMGIGRGTFYPRVWWHAADGQFFPNQAQRNEALAMHRRDIEQVVQPPLRVQHLHRALSAGSASSAPMRLSQHYADRRFEQGSATGAAPASVLRKRSVSWPPPDPTQFSGAGCRARPARARDWLE